MNTEERITAREQKPEDEGKSDAGWADFKKAMESRSATLWGAEQEEAYYKLTGVKGYRKMDEELIADREAEVADYSPQYQNLIELRQTLLDSERHLGTMIQCNPSGQTASDLVAYEVELAMAEHKVNAARELYRTALIGYAAERQG